MIIDLHMHSNVSDGKLSPADLVRLVHANGVELMALTDHDTMDGVRQASAAAEELGFEIDVDESVQAEEKPARRKKDEAPAEAEVVEVETVDAE